MVGGKLSVVGLVVIDVEVVGGMFGGSGEFGDDVDVFGGMLQFGLDVGEVVRIIDVHVVFGDALIVDGDVEIVKCGELAVVIRGNQDVISVQVDGDILFYGSLLVVVVQKLRCGSVLMIMSGCKIRGHFVKLFEGCVLVVGVNALKIFYWKGSVMLKVL